MPDRDGYPTDEELAKVRDWPSDDPVGWLAYIKSIWWAPEWGWSEKCEIDYDQGNRPFVRYSISTGGWSGNESILHAMRDTRTLWQQTWVQHRKGGHYVFEVKA